MVRKHPMIYFSHIKTIWKKHNTNFIFATLIAIFLLYSILIALQLNQGLIPDEPAHFTFSKHFSTTFGIPPDTFETYSWGWYIEQNPFLFYWLNGRVINLINLVYPSVSDFELLISLRLVGVLYSLCMVIFSFLLSKEVIQHKWWQLLPVFLLTNTLMFIFISGGVHYDNLANLLSMVGLYFLVKTLKRQNFLLNSFAWMISIALACLVKYPILPLALAMTISWWIFIIRNYKKLLPIKIDLLKTIFLSLTLAILFLLNFSIYGINLIRYQSLIPPCREILLESQCEISVYEQRHTDMALETKLTISESIAGGYPSPFRYVLNDWIYHLLLRSFGLSGHRAYFQFQLITYYQILFYLILILIFINLFFWRTFSHLEINLFWIVGFYTLILLLRNYNSELVYGFRQVAVQGRYLFPVIGGIYVLFAQAIKLTPIKFLRAIILIFSIGLFLWGGPIIILINYNTILASWFL
jgi:hypothetical protein